MAVTHLLPPSTVQHKQPLTSIKTSTKKPTPQESRTDQQIQPETKMDNQPPQKKVFRARALPKPKPKTYNLTVDVIDGKPPQNLVYQDDQDPWVVAYQFLGQYGEVDGSLCEALSAYIRNETGGRVSTEVQSETITSKLTPMKPRVQPLFENILAEIRSASKDVDAIRDVLDGKPSKKSGTCFGAPAETRESVDTAATSKGVIRLTRTVLQSEVRIGDLETKLDQLDINKSAYGHEQRIQALENMVKKLVKENVSLGSRLSHAERMIGRKDGWEDDGEDAFESTEEVL